MNLSSYKKIYENMEADKKSKNEISHASSHSAETAIPRNDWLKIARKNFHLIQMLFPILGCHFFCAIVHLTL